MKRTAIILSKQLGRGEGANAASILMGHAAKIDPELFHGDLLCDKDGFRHATVRFSIVILSADSSTQLSNYCRRLVAEFPDVSCAVFTSTGQALNNAFESYSTEVRSRTLDSLSPVAVLVTGEHERVRAATKKFSLAM
jgi:hypothetical protein